MLCEDGPLELIVNSVVAKVDRFDWAISVYSSHTCYPGCRRQVLKYSLVVEKFACTLPGPSTDTRIDQLILECTRVIQEKITKHDSQQIKTVTPPIPKVSESYLPLSLPPAAPFIVYSEQSTHQLALAPPSFVNTLPYRILLTRSAYGQQNSVQAGNVLHLLRHCDSVCHVPPVFHRRIGRGFWDGLSPVFHPVDNKWTFAFTLVGLVKRQRG